MRNHNTRAGARPFRMPFGIYTGEPVEDLPPDYLRWCLANLASMKPDLRREMKRVLASDPAATTTIHVLPAASEIQDWLKIQYRQASQRHHPDHGGSNERQLAVNEVFATLAATVGQIGGAK
jgi:Putative quorum-sensing-regulated virulence factor